MRDPATYQLLLLYATQIPLELFIGIASKSAGPALLPRDNASTRTTQKQLFTSLTAQNGLKSKQTKKPKCTGPLYLFVFDIKDISVTNHHLGALQ